MKKIITEILGNSEYEETPEMGQSVEKGTYSKPMIISGLIESFDSFRNGMDKLANIYTIMSTAEPDLYRKVSRFGEAMSKMLEGYSKLIEQQGGDIESVTKPEGLQKYFGTQGMSAIGMNENKEEIFNSRVDINIDRIKSIMKNGKR